MVLDANGRKIASLKILLKTARRSKPPCVIVVVFIVDQLQKQKQSLEAEGVSFLLLKPVIIIQLNYKSSQEKLLLL